MAQQSTAADTTTENDLPTTEWQGKTTSERTTFLVPLIGKRMRYITTREYRMGLLAYGPDYPKPWRETRFIGFDGNGRKPGLRVTSGQQAIMGWITNTVTFDAIYDIEMLPEKEPKAGSAEPDFDGADVYEADEVACPHCGKKLRIVQRATVEKIWEEEVAGDVS